MALSWVGADAVTDMSIPIPTHQVGDLIVVAAYDPQSTTPPPKPSPGGTVPAWVDIDANTGANSCAMRVVRFTATATNTTSGTWSTAVLMAVAVVRGQHSVPIGGHAESGSTGSASVAPAVGLVNTDGTSYILEFHAHNGVETWSAAPTGYTRRDSATSGRPTSGLALNTKDTTTSDGSVTQTLTGSAAGYRGATVEVLVSGAGPPAPPDDDGFWLF